jgi:hypothetical protein
MFGVYGRFDGIGIWAGWGMLGVVISGLYIAYWGFHWLRIYLTLPYISNFNTKYKSHLLNPHTQAKTTTHPSCFCHAATTTFQTT